LLSSVNCLYIIICIGYIADCSKPYRHRLESGSANIGYRLELQPSALSPDRPSYLMLHILLVVGSN
ncbi:hypothetical protein EE612_056312, partial [Oryza sativa]